MQACLLEQAAAPADARDARAAPAVDARCSSRRTADRRRAATWASTSLPRFDARRPRRRRPSALDQLGRRQRAQAPGRVGVEPLVLGHVRAGRHRARRAPAAAPAPPGADEQRLDRLAAAAARERRAPAATARRRPPRSCSTRTSTVMPPPARASRSTTAGAASAPSPRISACLPCPSGTTSRSLLEPRLGPLGRERLDRLLARAQLRRHRRVARQVDALEHA